MEEQNIDLEASLFPQEENKPLLDTQELDYVANWIGNSVARYLSRNEKKIRDVRGEFEKQVLTHLEEIYRGVVVMDPTSGRRQFLANTIVRTQGEIDSKLNLLSNQIGILQKTIESQTKVMEEQAAIIKRQHETIGRYESDVIYKTQKDLIMELIGIADQLKYVIQDFSETGTKEALLESVKDLKEWVDGSLQTVAVRPYVARENMELDVKRQEVVEVVETENIEENGMLRSVLPGYIWSVPMVGSNVMLQNDGAPKLYEFMIRPEQVARLKYKASVSLPDSLSEKYVKDDNQGRQNIEENQIEEDLDEGHTGKMSFFNIGKLLK